MRTWSSDDNLSPQDAARAAARAAKGVAKVAGKTVAFAGEAGKGALSLAGEAGRSALPINHLYTFILHHL